VFVAVFYQTDIGELLRWFYHEQAKGDGKRFLKLTNNVVRHIFITQRHILGSMGCCQVAKKQISNSKNVTFFLKLGTNVTISSHQCDVT